MNGNKGNFAISVALQKKQKNVEARKSETVFF